MLMIAASTTRTPLNSAVRFRSWQLPLTIAKLIKSFRWFTNLQLYANSVPTRDQTQRPMGLKGELDWVNSGPPLWVQCHDFLCPRPKYEMVWGNAVNSIWVKCHLDGLCEFDLRSEMKCRFTSGTMNLKIFKFTATTIFFLLLFASAAQAGYD